MKRSITALSQNTLAAISSPVRRATWKYVIGLAPVIAMWFGLVGWLVVTLYDRASWSEEADAATVREWLNEARSFRKTLPELVIELVQLEANTTPAGRANLARKQEEITEQLRALAEPTRMYGNQLPLFPEIFRLDVYWDADSNPTTQNKTLSWVSTVPRPERELRSQIRTVEMYPLGDDDRRVTIHCEYRLHALNKLQQRETDRQQNSLVAGALLITASLLSALLLYQFLERERRREFARLTAEAEKEHREVELLQSLMKQDEAEKTQRELNQQLLRTQLETADFQRRAAEAEKSTLEMKSQLYASIGIMAGSYAHNIKNLLVRPNDLIVRCIEAQGISAEQEGMLREVRSTLGTVTDRLQEILRTVRRDPSQSQSERLDLVEVLRETAQSWSDMARERWKVQLHFVLPKEPQWILGDRSHLQQAIENLLFNARDATFEMRNRLREDARNTELTSPASRKQKLIEAASWKGEIQIELIPDGQSTLLRVTDNGIGMTDDVRENCLRTHFSTKRDNALYEGYSAGMGLGLSFVAMVFEHHAATMSIESRPDSGTTFVVSFPVSSSA